MGGLWFVVVTELRVRYRKLLTKLRHTGKHFFVFFVNFLKFFAKPSVLLLYKDMVDKDRKTLSTVRDA